MWNINKFLKSLTLLLMLFSLQGQSVADTASDSRWESGQFKGFNLGKVNGSKIKDSDFLRLQKYGANLLRVNLRVTKNEDAGNYKIDKIDEDFLDKVISGSARTGISVVVTFEIQPSGDKADYWYNNQAKVSVGEIWKRLAYKYKDKIQVVGFDLLNEPVTPKLSKAFGNDIWREWALDWAKRIREADPNRTIIFEPAPWALPGGFADLMPLPIGNVVYSFHFYSPQMFTHQGIYEYPLGANYPGYIGSPPKYWNYAQLDSTLQNVRAFSSKYNVPIYVGEFSCIRYASVDSRFKYIQDSMNIFDKAKWSWTFHSFKEWDGWDPEIEANNKLVKIRSENGPLINLLTQSMKNSKAK